MDLQSDILSYFDKKRKNGDVLLKNIDEIEKGFIVDNFTSVIDYDLLKTRLFPDFIFKSCDCLKVIQKDQKLHLCLIELKDTKKTEENISDFCLKKGLDYNEQLKQQIEKFDLCKKFWDSLIILYSILSLSVIHESQPYLKMLKEIPVYYFVTVNETGFDYFKHLCTDLMNESETSKCRKLIDKMFDDLSLLDNCKALSVFNINIAEVKTATVDDLKRSINSLILT
jgi:hypothetical protein